MDTSLGAGVGDGGSQHADWVQYARTWDSAEADDVMANSDREMKAIENGVHERNYQDGVGRDGEFADNVEE